MKLGIGTLAFVCFLLLALHYPAYGGEKIYLSDEEAPKMVFPEAEEFEIRVVESTPELREKIKSLIGKVEPSIWEKEYKTFIVGVNPEGEAGNIAVMIYREPYGSEIRAKRFLKQYEGKTLNDPIRSRKDIVNISGATLSVRAANVGVKKALALISVVYLEGENTGD